MTARPLRPSLFEIEEAILRLSAEHFGFPIAQLSPGTRLIQDLNIDSLDLIEWMMAIEDQFKVSLPEASKLPDQVYKEVFTRPEFSLGDMAELVHLRWGTSPTPRTQLSNERFQKPTSAFTQLSGRLNSTPEQIYRNIGKSALGFDLFRRMTDGMVCVQLPGGRVEIGSNAPEAGPDEQPLHSIELPPFLMDQEIVSTSAYCRFLNSIGEVDEEVIRSWFWIAENERRHGHQLLLRCPDGWQPKAGIEEWPMILVSWHGANAYSRWANGADWRAWQDEQGSFLPSEDQWEYGARGPHSKRWPWGDGDPIEGQVNAGMHARKRTYSSVTELPIASVNELSAISPFGVVQMAGNVWQWCRDWYDPHAYLQRTAGSAQSADSSVRAERGGSWVGAVSLTRSSFRRGRPPGARGRCLGFRCIGSCA